MNIVNLNKARKAKTLRAAKARADENAVKFGRTKTEKSRDVRKTQCARVDDHKRER